MKSKVFSGDLDDDLSNNIYGLHGVPAPASQQYREEFFAAQGTPAGTGVNGAAGSALSGLGASSASGNFTSNNPSTPTTQHAGLSSQTPGYSGHTLGAGFGNFQYGGGK